MTHILAYKSAGDLSVSIQQIGDDVVLLAKYGRYEPWTTTIRVDDSTFMLVGIVMRDYANMMLRGSYDPV